MEWRTKLERLSFSFECDILLRLCGNYRLGSFKLLSSSDVTDKLFVISDVTVSLRHELANKLELGLKQCASYTTF